MALTWATDPDTSDLSILNGKFVRVYGAIEVQQRILITLRHFWYEYWLDLQGGVPWYELILGSKDRHMAEAILRRVILDVPGVINMLRFSTSFGAREYKIECMVLVQDTIGTTTVDINTLI